MIRDEPDGAAIDGMSRKIACGGTSALATNSACSHATPFENINNTKDLNFQRKKRPLRGSSGADRRRRRLGDLPQLAAANQALRRRPEYLRTLVMILLSGFVTVNVLQAERDERVAVIQTLVRSRRQRWRRRRTSGLANKRRHGNSKYTQVK